MGLLGHSLDPWGMWVMKVRRERGWRRERVLTELSVQNSLFFGGYFSQLFKRKLRNFLVLDTVK